MATKAKALELKTQSKVMKPPQVLANFFDNLPLIGDEKAEDYKALVNEIAISISPADVITWLYLADFADLSWEIRRQKILKHKAIRIAEQRIVALMLSPLDSENRLPREPSIDAMNKAMRWAADAAGYAKINKELAGRYDREEITAQAFSRSQSIIDAFDARIAQYEMRRMAALKMIEHYDGMLARRLEAASSKVIDGEFTEEVVR